MRDCCLFVRCVTTPPGAVTGYAHPKCYARDSQDCSRAISQEHYISASVLAVFGGGGFTVSGMPWIPASEVRQVSLASLTSGMLCKRHNEALSPLDAVACQFFRFLTAEWSGEEIEVFLSRGHDLERWLLKTLCGLVASCNATLHGEALPAWKPSRGWLEILFGGADVEAPAGLHCIVAKSYRAAPQSFHLVTGFKAISASPMALVFAVEGIALLLGMEELSPLMKPNATEVDTRYRPMALQLRQAEQIREAHFGWPAGEVITLDVRG